MVTEGADYTTVAQQTKEGSGPDTSNYSWGLCGAHNNWGNNDTKLVYDGTIGFHVAKNAKLTGEFKVRADNAWTVNYGGKTITVDSTSGMVLISNSGGNCKLSKTGTFDVYWDAKTHKIWVKTPGSAAPTK
jgi:hypothetical protein